MSHQENQPQPAEQKAGKEWAEALWKKKEMWSFRKTPFKFSNNDQNWNKLADIIESPG